MAHSPYLLIVNVHLVDIKVFAKLAEVPLLPVQDTKQKPKCRSRTD